MIFQRGLPRVAVVAIGIAALAFACDGGDGGPSVTVGPNPSPSAEATVAATPTPEATPAPTLTAQPTPTPEAEPPDAEEPTLDAGLTPKGSGDLSLTIGPGAVEGFDPVQVAQDNGIEVPPCAGFVFAFTWQVRDPYPTDGVDLEIRGTRMGGTETIGTGPSGDSTVGCMFIEMENGNTFAVTVEVRFAVGEFSG